MDHAQAQKFADEAAIATAVHTAQLSSVLINRTREECLFTSLGPVLIGVNPGRMTLAPSQATPVSQAATSQTSNADRTKKQIHNNARSWWRGSKDPLANTADGASTASQSKVGASAPAVPVFHASVMWQYFDSIQRGAGTAGRPGLPPHIFGTTAAAVRAAVTERAPQSLVLMGERGSGKSELHRQVLRYVATVSRALRLRQAQLVADLLKNAPGSAILRPLSMPTSPALRRSAYRQLLPSGAASGSARPGTSTPRDMGASGVATVARQTSMQQFSAAAAANSPDSAAHEAGLGRSSSHGPATSSVAQAVTTLATSPTALEQLLLDAHTVIDAFGSAGERASRSPCSSRFLRWTSLVLARDGSLEGARVHASLIDHWRLACPPHSTTADRWRPSVRVSPTGQPVDGSSAARYVSEVEHARHGSKGAGAGAGTYAMHVSSYARQYGMGGGASTISSAVDDVPVEGPAAVDTNFRAFYLLLAGYASAERLGLRLRDNPGDYAYLRAYGKEACPTLYIPPSRGSKGPAGLSTGSAGVRPGPFPGAAARYVSGHGGANEVFPSPLPPAAAEYLKREPMSGAGAASVSSDEGSAVPPVSLTPSVLAEEWAGLQAALTRLQLGAGAQASLWRLLSAILLLGDIQFAARDVPPSSVAPPSPMASPATPTRDRTPGKTITATVVANADVLWSVATLLGVPPERLATCLTTVPATARGIHSSFHVDSAMGMGMGVGPTLPVSPARACLIRDALACTLYRRLWSHLVAHINVMLSDASVVARAAKDEALGRLMAAAQACMPPGPKAGGSVSSASGSASSARAALDEGAWREREYLARVTRALAHLPAPTGAENTSPAVLVVVDGPGLAGVQGDGLVGRPGTAGLAAAFDHRTSGFNSGRGVDLLPGHAAGPAASSSFAGPTSFGQLLSSFTAEALEAVYQGHVFAKPAEQHSREGIPHPYLVSLQEGLRHAAEAWQARPSVGIGSSRSATPAHGGPPSLAVSSPSLEGATSRSDEDSARSIARPKALAPGAGGLGIAPPPVPGLSSAQHQQQQTAAHLSRSVSPGRRGPLPAVPFPDSRVVLSLLSRSPASEEMMRRLAITVGQGGPGAGLVNSAELLASQGSRGDQGLAKAALLTYIGESSLYCFPDPSTGLLGPVSAATSSVVAGGHEHGTEGVGLLPSHWRARDGQADADAVTSWLAQVHASRPGASAGLSAALRSLASRIPTAEVSSILGVRLPGPGAGSGHGTSSSPTQLEDGASGPSLNPHQVTALASSLFAVRHAHGWVAYSGEGMLTANAACPGCEESSQLAEGGRATGGLPEHLLRLMGSSQDTLTSILMSGGGSGPGAHGNVTASAIDPLTGQMLAEPGSEGSPGQLPLGFTDALRPHACSACANCMVELTSSLVTVLSSTRPHFVRCIRPCDDPAAPLSPLPVQPESRVSALLPVVPRGKDVLSPAAVERQLRTMGGLQLGLLAAYGLPCVMSGDVFWERFVPLDRACLQAGGPTLPGWSPSTSRHGEEDDLALTPALPSLSGQSSDSAFARRAGGSGLHGSTANANGDGSAKALTPLSRAALSRLAESLWARLYLPAEAKASTVVSAPLLRPDTPLQAAVPKLFRDERHGPGLDGTSFGYEGKGLGRIDAAFAIGRSAVFLSASFLACLEGERDRVHTVMDASAMHVQAWVRTRMCRVRYLRLRQAATTIQAFWRGRFRRRWFSLVIRAARNIKRFVLARHHRKDYVRKVQAATMMQKAWRRHVFPARMARLLHSVQALHELVRGYIIRAKMDRVYRAAVAVQRAVRAWRKRRAVKARRQQAALAMQSLYRSYRCRKAHSVESAVLLSLRVARRRRFVLRRFAARWKAGRTRSQYLFLRDTAVVIQGWMRARLLRRGFIRARWAVSILQAHWRGAAFRRVVREMRTVMLAAEEARRLQALRIAEIVGLGLVGDPSASSSRVLPAVLGPMPSNRQQANPAAGQATSLRLIDVEACASGLADVYYSDAALARRAVEGSLPLPAPTAAGAKPGATEALLTQLRKGLGMPAQDGAPASPSQQAVDDPSQLYLPASRPNGPLVPVPRASWSAVFRSLCIGLAGRDATVASVGVGETHSAVACSAGRVYTWGWSDRGQLGCGSTAPSPTPRVVSSLVDPNHPAHPHADIADEQQAALSYGARRSMLPRNPMLHGLGRTPIHVTAVACGRDHTLALSNTGLVYSWGASNRGQCGVGHTDSVAYPILITDGPHKPVVAIACGDAHSVLLTQMGAVYTCGAGPASGLGRSPQSSKPGRPGASKATPQAEASPSPDVLVPTVVSSITQTAVKAVACGRAHTVVLGAAGEAYAWGVNDAGQLGQDPQAVHVAFAPIPMALPSASQGQAKLPARSISPGSVHTAVTKASVVTTDSNGRQVRRPRGTVFVSVACGSKHTLLLTSAGRVYATGANAHGQLGLGDKEDRAALEPVSFGPSDGQGQDGPAAVSIAAAGHASYAIVTTAGEATLAPTGPFVRGTRATRMRELASGISSSGDTAGKADGPRTVFVWGRAGVVTEAKLRTVLLRTLAVTLAEDDEDEDEAGVSSDPARQASLVSQAISFASQGQAAMAALTGAEVRALAGSLHVDTTIKAGRIVPQQEQEAELPVGTSVVELLVPTPVPRAASGAQGPTPLTVSASGHTALLAAWVRTTPPQPSQAEAGRAGSVTAAGRQVSSDRPASVAPMGRLGVQAFSGRAVEPAAPPSVPRRSSIASAATGSSRPAKGLVGHVEAGNGLVRRAVAVSLPEPRADSGRLALRR